MDISFDKTTLYFGDNCVDLIPDYYSDFYLKNDPIVDAKYDKKENTIHILTQSKRHYILLHANNIEKCYIVLSSLDYI